MASDYERIRQANLREYGEGTRHLDFLQLLYADRTHFIFELLQNAEDAHATQVVFVLDPHRLAVRHDGRPFDEDDVRGICGVSASTKEDELTAIGKFGIGFKSVYAHTTLPEVHSGDEHFRIRHYVRPEPAPRPTEPLNSQTLFLFPFDRDDLKPETAYAEIRAGLYELDPITLLFMTHIQGITVESGTGTVDLTRTRGEASPHDVELIRRIDGQVVLHQHWSTFQRPLGRIGHPEQRVEIAFKRSGPEPDAPVERLRRSPLIAYFPTDKETRLGFLLQAPLRTTPARDNVPEHDPDNIAMIGEATVLLLDTLERFRDTGRLGLDVFEALPINVDEFPERSMLRPLFDALSEALRTRCLLPTADEAGHRPASEVRLARGGGIRDLLSPTQLGALADAPGPLHWQPTQLTRERNRRLWDYLRHEIGIDEITPDWVVEHYDLDFLRDADDSWLIRLYAFLALSPALWRPARGGNDRSGQARTMPLVRLEDGSHVTPFTADGRPNAYLPGTTPSDYPTVRRAIADDPDASAFLTGLGLQPPDAVDEVMEKVLPRYQVAGDVTDDEQHERDLDVIGRALRVASGQTRTFLVTRLRSTAFLMAANANQSAAGYRTPAECYWSDEDLRHYFQPCPDTWFLSDRYAGHRRDLTELGVADQVRVHARAGNSAGYVVLRDQHGVHRRGLDGFDPDLRIAGLDAALTNPDPRRSAYLWNRLLVPHAGRLRGTVESASRQDYTKSARVEQDAEPRRLAIGRPWLPTAAGDFAAPRDLRLDDLPDEFARHNGLAEVLGMSTSVVEQASTELGIPLSLLRYLADTPDALADVTRAAEKALRASAAPPPQTPNVQTCPVDFPISLQDAFARPAEGGSPSDDDDGVGRGGQVAAPAMRRERTAAAIQEARAAEPVRHERSRFVPRKIWDSKSPDIRPFLGEQYAGRCQICQASFAKRSGGPYFEVVYLVSHTSAAWIDRPGNVLCLCPTCAAKFLHADVRADDVLDQIRSWRTTAEGGGPAALCLTICGEPREISYTEKHLLDLQTMITEIA